MAAIGPDIRTFEVHGTGKDLVIKSVQQPAKSYYFRGNVPGHIDRALQLAYNMVIQNASKAQLDEINRFIHYPEISNNPDLIGMVGKIEDKIKEHLSKFRDG